MRKFIYITISFLLLLLAVGCGSDEAETAVPAQPVVPAEAGTDMGETDTDVQVVAAKPQLIEFYAHW